MYMYNDPSNEAIRTHEPKTKLFPMHVSLLSLSLIPLTFPIIYSHLLYINEVVYYYNTIDGRFPHQILTYDIDYIFPSPTTN